MSNKNKKTLPEEENTFESNIQLFLDEMFHPMWDIKNKQLEPLAYMNNLKDKIVITVDLPLVRKQDIQISMTDDMLEIKAMMQRCISFSKWGATQRECKFESFYKTISMPARVDIDKVQTKFVKGILTIEIPKVTKQRGIRIA